MPLCCVATDIITGFPGETDDDFDETLQFIQSLDISYMHVFTYSERSKTRAAGSTNNVPDDVKKRRSKVLHHVSEEKKGNFYMLNKGRTAKVFFESANKGGYIYGFTENYVRARHSWRSELVNKIAEVRLHELAADGSYNTLY
jgi:threonylcarbamoyladenosine tRNA methylthiotransferase MtaB